MTLRSLLEHLNSVPESLLDCDTVANMDIGLWRDGRWLAFVDLKDGQVKTMDSDRRIVPFTEVK